MDRKQIAKYVPSHAGMMVSPHKIHDEKLKGLNNAHANRKELQKSPVEDDYTFDTKVEGLRKLQHRIPYDGIPRSIGSAFTVPSSSAFNQRSAFAGQIEDASQSTASFHNCTANVHRSDSNERLYLNNVVPAAHINTGEPEPTRVKTDAFDNTNYGRVELPYNDLPTYQNVLIAQTIDDIGSTNAWFDNAGDFQYVLKNAYDTQVALINTLEAQMALTNAIKAQLARNYAYEAQMAPNNAIEAQIAFNNAYKAQNALNNAIEAQTAINNAIAAQVALNNALEAQIAINNAYKGQAAFNDAVEAQMALNKSYESQGTLNPGIEARMALNKAYEAQMALNNAVETQMALNNAYRDQVALNNAFETQMVRNNAYEAQVILNNIEAQMALNNEYKAKAANNSCQALNNTDAFQELLTVKAETLASTMAGSNASNNDTIDTPKHGHSKKRKSSIKKFFAKYFGCCVKSPADN